MYTYVHTHIYTSCMIIRSRTRACACKYVCMYVCMYIWICVQNHTRIAEYVNMSRIIIRVLEKHQDDQFTGNKII